MADPATEQIRREARVNAATGAGSNAQELLVRAETYLNINDADGRGSALLIMELADALRAALSPPPAKQQIRREGSPDDIRAQGWSVAVHNDYRLDGVPHTFWLFTKEGRAIKGEGLNDASALDAIRSAIALLQTESKA